jgi:hypothetical protein
MWPSRRSDTWLLLCIGSGAFMIGWHFQSYGPTSTPSVPVHLGKGCTPNISVKYFPSKLEQTWLKHARDWDANFCDHMPEFNKDVESWLQGVAQSAKLTAYDANNTDVFSFFEHTATCGTSTHVYKTWIEPLSHGLRHPNALCGRGADIVDRSYLLMAFQGEIFKPKPTTCGSRPCQAIYMDLGASTWNTGAGGPSQEWFIKVYRDHGIEFDRMFMFEAHPVNPPSSIFAHVPRDLWHKYQYYNIPATTDPNDPSSPIGMLKATALPGDFVLFKVWGVRERRGEGVSGRSCLNAAGKTCGADESLTLSKPPPSSLTLTTDPWKTPSSSQSWMIPVCRR